MKILMVLTSHDRLGNTGRKTGFWLEELAAPYFVFRDAGVDVTLASPKGGQPPLDPKSNDPLSRTDDTRRFERDASATRALANTVKLSDVDPADYDSVFFPGGHGPLWDLANDRHALKPANVILVLYQRLLDKLAARDFARPEDRVSLSTPEKLWIALRYGLL